MRIFLDGYGSKIRKVSRWRPIVLNEAILATKQEFFFTKVAPVQCMTDIALLGFWLILLPWMFISSYITICFFVRNFFFFWMFIFQWIRYSNALACIFGWEIGHPLSTYATGGMEGGHMCTGAYWGWGVQKSLITYVRTIWMAQTKCCGVFFVNWFGQVH